MGIVDHNNCINCRNEDYNYQRLKPNFGIVINAVDGGSNISGTLEGRTTARWLSIRFHPPDH